MMAKLIFGNKNANNSLNKWSFSYYFENEWLILVGHENMTKS